MWGAHDSDVEYVLLQAPILDHWPQDIDGDCLKA